MPNTLLIDNYDSFTYNLYQLIANTTGTRPTVVRNDEMEWSQLERQNFDRIVISPGPGRPQRAADVGLSAHAMTHSTLPILGVCLGHQLIGHASGAKVGLAAEPVHGRMSLVWHNKSDLFEGIPSPFGVVRYHSLAVTDLPDELEATAWTEDGTIMALRHRSRPLWGVQFHPESISTEYGETIVQRFFELSRTVPPRVRNTPARAASSPPRSAAARGAYACKLESVLIEADPDPVELFSKLFARSKDAFWLDSSLRAGGIARFSYMGDSSGPNSQRLRYWAAKRTLEVTANGIVSLSKADIFDHLEKETAKLSIAPNDLPFDFQCGYAGYFSYELKGLLEGESTPSAATPDACWIFADRMVVFDHLLCQVWLVCLVAGEQIDPRNALWLDHVKRVVAEIGESEKSGAPPPAGAKWPLTDLKWRHGPAEYRHMIERSMELIRQGETYEICLTNQLSAKGTANPLMVYQHLRGINPSPYACFLKMEGLAVLCASPELFLSVGSDRLVTSKPIKGTAPRHANPREDARLAEELQNSIKGRSENLMIVDLLRNDLGRVCEVGSVYVPALFAVESFATVHHLVSTICGRLAADKTVFDCIRSSFPGGSMTGAPKVRTMRLIDELEGGPRGIYSGSMGFLSLSGAAQLNIVIRTIVFHQSRITMSSGGAIVALSDPDEELDEVVLKLQSQLRTLRLSGAEFDVEVPVREMPSAA